MEIEFEMDSVEFGCESSFPCPECGELISSEGKSEIVYSISEVRIEKGTIQDLRVRCNCGATAVEGAKSCPYLCART